MAASRNFYRRSDCVLFPSSLPSSCWMECGRDGWNSSGPLVYKVALRMEPTDTKRVGRVSVAKNMVEQGHQPHQHQTECLRTSILGGKKLLSCFNHCCSDSLLVTAKANLIFGVKIRQSPRRGILFIHIAPCPSLYILPRSSDRPPAFQRES